MTAIVGVLCKDGVVLGTDSSTTFSTGAFPTIEQPTEKLFMRGDVIVAGTGAVGHGQRFCEIVRQAWDQKKFQEGTFAVTKHLTRSAIQDLQETGSRLGLYGALIAFSVERKPHLCEFAVSDFQPEFKTAQLWYASMGSGQMITDPFLALMRNIYWADGPPAVYDGVFAVTWALDHAIEVNPGGINGPVRVAVLERVKSGAFQPRLLDEAELAEHRQHIDAAKGVLREHRSQQVNASDAPAVPKLPTTGPLTT